LGFGTVLLVAGAGLAYWGYREAGSLGSRLDEAISGSPSDNVMIQYIAGAVSAAAAILLLTRN
jgi:hypothetical protein